MKFSLWLLLSTSFLIRTSLSISETSVIASAISQIVESVFANSIEGFDFMIVRDRMKNRKVDEIINKAAKKISIPHRERIGRIGNLREANRSAIFFYNSWETYTTFQYILKLNNKTPKDFYFIIVVGEPMNSLEKFFHDFPPPSSYSQFYFNYFLVSDGKSLVLKTFERFKQPNCKAFREINVNRFSKSSLKWQTKRFSVRKNENFNGCKMNIAMPYTNNTDNKNLALTAHLDSDGKFLRLSGYILRFNEVISKSLNYAYSYEPVKVIDTDAAFGIDYLKELSFNDKISFRLDVSSHRKNQNNLRPSTFSLTQRYTTVDEIILISRFKPYSMYDKIFMPFEIEVWQWLVGTLLTLFLVSSLIVCFAPKHVRNFVFGTKVQSPLLNIM
jgi:hypothetical protein